MLQAGLAHSVRVCVQTNKRRKKKEEREGYAKVRTSDRPCGFSFLAQRTSRYEESQSTRRVERSRRAEKYEGRGQPSLWHGFILLESELT